MKPGLFHDNHDYNGVWHSCRFLLMELSILLLFYSLIQHRLGEDYISFCSHCGYSRIRF